MVSILFRLLIVQITIQLTMANDLKGRTAHYVKLLTTQSTDVNAMRLTCPVYSIKLANETAKFTKYIASESQFIKINWTERDAISTFKECAEKATDEKDSMFMWVRHVCSTSKILFTRQAEPCNEKTSTLVYMVKPRKSWCFGKSLIYPEGTTLTGSMCGNQPDSLLICYDGKLYGEKDFVWYYNDGTGCFIIDNVHDVSHTWKNMLCGSKSKCLPKDSVERPAYLQLLREIAVRFHQFFGGTKNVDFMVPIICDMENPCIWMTPSVTGLTQPSDVAGEWKQGFPTTEMGEKTSVYMTHEGLINDVSIGVTDYFCCYEENSVPAIF